MKKENAFDNFMEQEMNALWSWQVFFLNFVVEVVMILIAVTLAALIGMAFNSNAVMNFLSYPFMFLVMVGSLINAKQYGNVFFGVMIAVHVLLFALVAWSILA